MATIIQRNLIAIQQLITAYEQQYQRPSGSVQLLAVSKSQPIEKIIAAVQAGQKAFGESYLQEALHKITALAHVPALEWHFIGPVQSNKTRKIAQQFAWVHSIDNVKVAKRLNDQRPAALPPLNICIQVNVSTEVSKAGVMVADVPSLAAYCRTLPRLSLRGLMAIPAPVADFVKEREQFHQLYLIWQKLNQTGYTLDTLSMGMSDDFEAAIAEGSTLVRIGTALFGERAKNK